MPTNAENEYRKAAERGDAVAQFNLGMIYCIGNDAPQNYDEAVNWFRKAAEQGHAAAQCNLGWCCEYGNGTHQDFKEAVKWYRKAAQQNNAIAECNLGNCYYAGSGVPQNYFAALKWYREAAEQGDAVAQVNLGECYDFGQGVPRSETDAVVWWLRAAEQGYAKAQFKLGKSYDCGHGVEQNFEEAVKWLRKAADQGDADAQCALGICYKDGDDDGEQRNYTEAVMLFRKAAEQGHAGAQYQLYESYHCVHVVPGVPANEDEADKWLHKAFEQDNAEAQCELGGNYDKAEADKLCRKAAEQGYGQAQWYLAAIYEEDQDVTEALKWLILAAGSGYDDGTDDEVYHHSESDALKKIMTPEQIAEAEKRAREFAEALASRKERLTALSARLSEGPKKQTAEPLDKWVETLPFPLASILRKWQATRRDDSDKTVRHLSHFFETSTEFIAVILLSALSSQEYQEELDQDLEKRNKSLRRADFGTWKAVVEFLGKKVRDQIKGSQDQRTHCGEMFADPSLRLPEVLSRLDLLEIIKTTNTIRDQIVHPNRFLAPEEAKPFHDKLLPELIKFREVMGNLWSSVQLVHALHNTPRRGFHENEVEILMGSNSEVLMATRCI